MQSRESHALARLGEGWIPARELPALAFPQGEFRKGEARVVVRSFVSVGGGELSIVRTAPFRPLSASRVPGSRPGDACWRPRAGKPNRAGRCGSQTVYGATPNTTRETRALPGFHEALTQFVRRAELYEALIKRIGIDGDSCNSSLRWV